jgi:hypothetical protein
VTGSGVDVVMLDEDIVKFGKNVTVVGIQKAAKM